MPVGEDHLGRGRKPRRNPEIVWMKRTEAHDDFIISPLMSLFPFFQSASKSLSATLARLLHSGLRYNGDRFLTLYNFLPTRIIMRGMNEKTRPQIP